MSLGYKYKIFSLCVVAVLGGGDFAFAKTLQECKNNADRKSGCIEKKYYKNGKIESEIPYKNGEKRGIGKWYYENGNLEYETPFKNGKKEGIERKYYSNGNLEAEIPFKNGKKEGIEIGYYPNGNLEYLIPFKNNKREGIAKLYFITGKLDMQINFNNDKPIAGKCGYGKLFTNAHLYKMKKGDFDGICEKNIKQEK